MPAAQYPVANGPYTFDMKIKVENFAAQGGNSAATVEFKNGAALDEAADAITADTEGYITRSYTIDGADLSDEFRIGLLFAEGDLYIADLVVKDKYGTVKYSFELGRHPVWNVRFLEYLYLGILSVQQCGRRYFQRVQRSDPETYAPSRYLKLACTTDAQPQFALKLPADKYPAANGPFTFDMKIKVENFAAQGGSSAATVEFKNGAALDEAADAITADTEGYITRSYTIDGADLSDEFRIGLLFAEGDLYIADLVIRDKDGIIRYSLNSDATLNGMTTFANTDTWVSYLYNNAGGATFTAYTSEDHDNGRDPVVDANAAPPPVVELPDFDPGDAPTDTGDINRSITIVSSNMQTSTMTLSFFRDDAKIPDGFYLIPPRRKAPMPSIPRMAPSIWSAR